MKQAMIFAAGLGTRLRPLTDTMPKALVPVARRPLLHHVILRLKEAGFERIVVNVHHFGQQIIDDLEANHHFGLDIRISDERDLLLDTGGGLKHAAGLFDPESPILIHNVDILSDIDLTSLLEAANQSDTAALAISRRESRSGRYLLFDADSRLVGWTNATTGEVRSPLPDALRRTTLRAPFAGIHAFHPSLFALMDSWPERFSIIDFYLSVCHTHRIFGHLGQFRLIDVGKLNSLSEAEAFLQQIQ